MKKRGKEKWKGAFGRGQRENTYHHKDRKRDEKMASVQVKMQFVVDVVAVAVVVHQRRLQQLLVEELI